MFRKFLENYGVTEEVESLAITNSDADDSSFVETIHKLGGKTFSGGLYRVIPGQDVTTVTDWVVEAFPDYKDRVRCFGYDWLGRVFAVDVNRDETILRFEHSFHEVIVIPGSIIDFHEDILIESADAALSDAFYKEWLGAREEKVSLSLDDCVGYEKSLFLGGEDVVENLEITNFEVYISLCHQIYTAVQDLPEGATINDVTVE